MTPAERHIATALELIAEMPKDPRLTEAQALLFRAADRVGEYVRDQGRHRTREADTLPSPPPSTRSELPTVPDGAA